MTVSLELALIHPDITYGGVIIRVALPTMYSCLDWAQGVTLLMF